MGARTLTPEETFKTQVLWIDAELDEFKENGETPSRNWILLKLVVLLQQGLRSGVLVNGEPGPDYFIRLRERVSALLMDMMEKSLLEALND